MTPACLDAATCWQLTLALWHTTWIGVLVGCLAAAGNWLLRRGTAPQRYALHFGALLVVGASLPLTFAVIRWTEPAIDAAPADLIVSAPAPASTESEAEMRETAHAPPPGAPPVDPAIASAMRTDGPTDDTNSSSGVPSAAAPVEPSAIHPLRHHMRAAAPFITALYLLGVAAMLVKLLTAIYGGQRLRAAGRPMTDPQLLDILACQSRRLALRFVPVVAYCERVAVPVVIGVIRPMILAPAVMVSGLTPDELVAVLTHELAHIHRYDHLLILVQRFVESALFFHPAVWYLSRRVHHERETCCDDMVVAANGDRLAYARSLLRVAELRLAGDNRGTQLAALAADGQRPSELRQRIARLLGDPAEPNIRFRNRWPATLLGLACAAAIWAVSATTWQVLAEIKRDRSETERTDVAIDRADGLDPPLRPDGQSDLTDAEALAFRIVASMRKQKLSFIGEEQLETLGTELCDYLGERLKQPLPEARREDLLRGIDQFVAWYFQYYHGDNAYLGFRDWLHTLKWELWIAAVRPELDIGQRTRRDEQRKWVRDYVRSLPAPRGLEHRERLDELERIWADPLNPFVQEPLSESAFAEFQAKSKGRGGEQSLLFVHSDLFSVMVESQLDTFLKKWPVPNVGGSRLDTYYQLTRDRSSGFGAVDFPDVSQRALAVYLDLERGIYVPGARPADPSARAAWLEEQNQGDLCYEGKQDALIAVRGAKLAVLDATSWIDADRVKGTDLRRLIAEKGQVLVPLSHFLVKTFPDANIRQTKPDAPSLVVQTKAGKIWVLRLTGFGDGPVANPRPRPLSPNPPLHAGEEDPADDGDAKRKQTQAIETWLKNLAGEEATLRAQAAAEIKQWRIDKPREESDPRLIKALVRLLDNEEMARHGPLTQRVGDWCREALSQIGKPAVAELIAVAGKGPDKLRKRVVESLGAIQAVGPKGVEVLIGLLDHANYEVSGAAVSALARLNNEPTLIPKLIEATKNGPLPTRYRAVGVLGHFDDERVNPVILKALDDDERLVRLWGVHAAGQKPRPKLAAEFISRLKTDDLEFRGPLETVLFRMAKDAVEPLIAGMDDDDPRVRAGCIMPLRETMPETALRVAPLVIRSLTDKDAAVRRQALMHVAFAARWFERDLLVEPLVKNLGDKDAELREQAADALRNFAETWPTERRPVEPLLAVLDDAEPAVVAGAVRALTAFREPKAIAALVRLAGAGGEPGRAASEALGILRDQRGREVLRQNLVKRVPADIEALGKLHDRQSIPQFIELLSDPDDNVRSAAAKALALNPDPRAVEPLMAGLKLGFGGLRPGLRGDRNNTTLAIAEALGYNGDPRGIAAMIAAIDDAVSPFEQPFGDNFEPTFPLTLDGSVSLHPFAWPLFRAGLPALPELAKGLSSPSVKTRQVCAWVLDNLAVQGGLETADFHAIRAPLLAGLRDDDPVVRLCLVKTIGRLKLRGAEGYLLKLLETPVSETATAVKLPKNSLPAATQIQIAAIGAMFDSPSDRVRDALLRTLEHPHPAVRAAAAGHLGQFPAAVIVGPLLKALADPAAAAESARVLGHVGDPRAIAPLIDLLKSDASPTVRPNAAQSLGLLGAADARPALRDVLEQVPAGTTRSDQFEVQLSAAVSLVQLQDEAGTSRLKELLESPDLQTRNEAASRLRLATYFSEWRPPARLTHEPTRALMRHFAEHAPDTPTRLYLMEALGGDLDGTTREFLERRGNDKHDPLRWAAWRTLARPNPAAYETQLLAMLDDSDDKTRRDIVFFLAQIATPRVTDRLLALTSAGDDELRIAVTAGLAKHRSPAVDARLRDLAANDPSPHVRLRAAKVLAAAAVSEK